uniref:Uncharacterized protein n=1 Tax=Anguilla anguilla TaxID=7936 RepID=A0A0E9RWT4_ANGAN
MLNLCYNFWLQAMKRYFNLKGESFHTSGRHLRRWLVTVYYPAANRKN